LYACLRPSDDWPRGIFSLFLALVRRTCKSVEAILSYFPFVRSRSHLPTCNCRLSQHAKTSNHVEEKHALNGILFDRPRVNNFQVQLWGITSLVDTRAFCIFLIRVRSRHYRNRVLCRVSKTLGKGYFTLGKAFVECNTRQRTLGKDFIGKGFFAECFFSDTRQKHSAKKNTRQIKNRKNLKKQQNIFLNSRKNSPILPITLSVALSFFTIILNQI
jgi:hypothetical protein